jgi:hypothetical protein
MVRDLMVADSVIVTGRFNASRRRKRERVEPVIRASSDSCGKRGRVFSDCAACRAAVGIRYGRGSGKRVPPMAGDIEDPGRTEDGGYLGRLVIGTL